MSGGDATDERRAQQRADLWPFGELTPAQKHAKALMEFALRGTPTTPPLRPPARRDDSPRHQLDTYRAMLKAHDWEFEHTDDQRAWHAGTMRLAMLRQWQRRVDPNGSIWNSRCALGYELGPVVPRADDEHGKNPSHRPEGMTR